MLALPGAKNSMFVKILNEVVTPQLDAGADYIYLFPPEENGSQYCEQAVYHAPGMEPDILARASPTAFTIGYPLGS